MRGSVRRHGLHAARRIHANHGEALGPPLAVHATRPRPLHLALPAVAAGPAAALLLLRLAPAAARRLLRALRLALRRRKARVHLALHLQQLALRPLHAAQLLREQVVKGCEAAGPGGREVVIAPGAALGGAAQRPPAPAEAGGELQGWGAAGRTFSCVCHVHAAADLRSSMRHMPCARRRRRACGRAAGRRLGAQDCTAAPAGPPSTLTAVCMAAEAGKAVCERPGAPCPEGFRGARPCPRAAARSAQGEDVWLLARSGGGGAKSEGWGKGSVSRSTGCSESRNVHDERQLPERRIDLEMQADICAPPSGTGWRRRPHERSQRLHLSAVPYEHLRASSAVSQTMALNKTIASRQDRLNVGAMQAGTKNTGGAKTERSSYTYGWSGCGSGCCC